MMSLRTLALFYFAFSIAGCSFTNTTGNPAGAVIGGAAGAGGAALLGANKVGVAVAGVAGAGLGYYVTTLGAAAEGVRQAGGQVYTLGELVTIVIPSDKLFDVNTSDLLPEADPILDSALAVINRYPDHNVMISGNTSGFSIPRYEQKLSEARARQVAAYFWSKGISDFKYQSIETRRLIYVGFGDAFPIANNIKANSLRQNSRIQITLYPSHLDQQNKCFRAFHDVGAINDDLPETRPQNFRGMDLKGEIQDPPQRYIRRDPPRPAAPLENETIGNYNNDSSAFHTSTGKVEVKQGAYTGKDD